MTLFVPSNRRAWHNIAYLGGGVSAFAVVLLLFLPWNESFHANGPMAPGHETLSCAACHQQEVGTFRQRLQANVRYLLGWRATSVSLGHRPVGNAACLRCHERPNERHPVYRFLEPRYAKVRAAIAPQWCVSCHREHTGQRVTVAATICQHCHDRLKLRNDPIRPSHVDLIKLEQWESCLGCHDFHGNHKMWTPRQIEAAISTDRIRAYLHNADSPYGHKMYYPVRREEPHDK
jgi:hypothetical protein